MGVCQVNVRRRVESAPAFIFASAIIALTVVFSMTGAEAAEKKITSTTLRVVRVTPEAAGAAIPVDTVFFAEFSRELDPNAVDEKYVSLSTGGKAVGFELRYLKARGGVEVRPSSKLKHDSEYRLVFRTGIADRLGRKLPAATMFQYFTEPSPDSPPVRVTSVSPREGERILDEKPLITATFDQKVANRLGDYSECMSLFEGQARIPAEVEYVSGERKLVMRPTVRLKSGSSYRATVSRKVCGPNGKCLPETHVWSFSTVKIDFFLTYSYPNSNDGTINSFERVLLSFSEPLNPRTQFEDFISVVDSQGKAVPGRFIHYNVKNVIFIPDFSFPSGAYKIFISGKFKSLNGNETIRDTEIGFLVKNDEFNNGGTNDAERKN